MTDKKQEEIIENFKATIEKQNEKRLLFILTKTAVDN